MAIDCHYHLTPDIQSIADVIASMDRHGIDRTALMASLCGPVPEPAAPVLSLLRFCLTHKRLRPPVRRLLTRFTPDGHVILPSGVVRLHARPDNRPVFAAAETHPDRFYAWCTVRPGGPVDPVDEYRAVEHHPACIGVKAHPFWHRYSPLNLLTVGERLARNKAPLIVHLGFDDPADLLTLSDELPGLSIILAHAAFPCYADTWQKIRNRKNIYVDLSATAYVDMTIMKQVSEALGTERCLFGTDGPFGSHDPAGGFDQGLIRRRIETVFPDPGVRRRILGANFLECIGRHA
jgi:predicted TIM-barrel fold metal-dependent hydrolase